MPTHYECAVMCQKSSEIETSNVLSDWKKLFFTGNLTDVQEPAYFHPATAYINNNTKEICIAFHESNLIEEIPTLKKEYGIRFDWQKQLADRLEYFFKDLPSKLKSAAILLNYINFRIKLLIIRKMYETSTSKAKLKPVIEMLNQIEPTLPSQFKADEINQALPTVNKILDKLKNFQTSSYQFTYTGYSTGAVIAGLFARRDKIKAVLFESPGYKDLVEGDHRFQNYNEEDTTCYLIAPNHLNTFRLHVGNPCRLYTSHITANQYFYTNAICSSATSMQRLSQKLVMIIFLGNLLFYKAESKPPLISDFRFIFFLILLNAVISSYKFLTVEKRPSLDSCTWFSNQHSLDKLLLCFDPGSGQPKRTSLMKSWPSAKDLENHWANWEITSHETELFKFFCSYRKGIATIFRLNKVIEEKIAMINNYKVEKDNVINPENNQFFNASLR